MVKKILLLSANPTDTSKLSLDLEVREIEAGLERAKHRQEFEIIPKLAVRIEDLRRALLDYDPQIVHFSGHSVGDGGLVLENNSGQMQLVSVQSLARLFKLFQDTIECVVLNACYSEVQAEAIHQHIDYVIGMSQAVGDKTAINFAVGFYDALGAGRSIEDGFEFGCTSIDLKGIPEGSTPVLKSKKSKTRDSKRIFISYKRYAQPDQQVALEIFQTMSPYHEVFIDQKILVGTRWAEMIEIQICQADFLIVLLSEHSVHSEMIETEIRMAHEFGQVQKGSPTILPVRLNYREPFQYPLSAYLNNINWAFWQDLSDTPRLIKELKQAVAGNQLTIDKPPRKIELIQESKPSPLPRPFPSAQPSPLEMPSGTMDSSSVFYVERPSDAIALRIIQRRGVTITIKGPRQVGKSSLLNRIIDAAVKAGKRVAFLDFQLFNKAALNDPEIFFRRFCFWLADVLEIDDKVDEYWNPALGNSRCCTRYIGRYILKELSQPLVLAMDEVDKVFDSDFRSDFFGMLRSWHNSRATKQIWKNLDLVLVTSTEPYQLIDDLNQSPFNVGEVMELADFTPEQLADLNQRHNSPFNVNEEKQLMMLLAGHPYLVRKSLYSVASGQISPAELFANASAEHGLFGDHLRHLLSLLRNKTELIQGLSEVINHNSCKDKLVFWRLRGAGLVRESGRRVLPRCQLYAGYFQDNLHV
ncbi:AAA-like domain-containing protein [Mastigocoleus sp. MO_188.B34]|uniref:AAA-like domain-containing protein n=1 Tax=Mastigocoleus sp. MO_188.B34 TaxID=3036635 RepID=UPI00261D97D6|nr:AAA-like domain-containing protein [Mastigocoleus sp. MO_188.B34]MDJ0695390.1 AAA-like domain-containing protein [Mastigocoleus sp. MO_188.B34]